MPLTSKSVPLGSSLILIVLAWMAASGPVRAQLVDVPATWGGDVWSRPRLTGDWGGLRDELGKKGVVFGVDLLVTPMDVLSGGRSTGGDNWGNVDYTLNVDTDKLGLWPGGVLKISGDSSFGSITQNSGAIVPINTATLIPGAGERTTVLMNATSCSSSVRSSVCFWARSTHSIWVNRNSMAITARSS
jgi:porin